MNSDDCLAALQNAFSAPGLAVASPTAEQGWDFWTFVVDGEWIFRFPRNSDAARALEREFALLPVIAPRLPVAVPHYTWKGEWADLPFGGYRLIVGQAYEPGAFSVPTLARSLGEALHALHGIPIELAATRLGQDPSGSGWIDGQRRFLVAAREALGLLEPSLLPHLDALITAYLEFAAGDWPPALIHNDLGPVHILGQGEQLTGIIDWSDMTIGDPAQDFAGILGSAGEAAFLRVVDAYDRWQGEDFKRRVRYQACVAPLHDVLHGIATANQAILRDGIEGFSARQELWKG